MYFLLGLVVVTVAEELDSRLDSRLYLRKRWKNFKL